MGGFDFGWGKEISPEKEQKQDKTGLEKKKDGEGELGVDFGEGKAEMQTRLVYCYVCRCGENKGQKGTD